MNNVPLNGWPQIKDLPELQNRVERIAKIEAWKADTSYIEETGSSVTIDNCLGVPASELTATLAPTQSLNGFDKPWAGGAGKNKLPLVLADIKTANTGGTWDDNVYTFHDGTFEIMEENNAVTGIVINGTFSAMTVLTLPLSYTTPAEMILNGCPVGGGSSNYQLDLNNGAYADTGSSATIPAETELTVLRIRMASGASVSDLEMYPMLRLATETDATFEPYTNICPITGITTATVQTTDGTDTNSASMALGETVYAGSVDFNEGSGESTMASIDAYDGETISEPWLSSMDEYVEGGTPTTGAQVVYTLETPAELTLTPDPLTMLRDSNTVTTNCETITIKALTGRAF